MRPTPRSAVTAAAAALLVAMAPRPGHRPAIACATSAQTAEEIDALHEYWRAAGVLAATPARSADRDEDHVAILEDGGGDLTVRRNPFDLDRAALRLVPGEGGGFRLARVAVPLEGPGQSIETLGEQPARVALPFPFSFFGGSYTEVFVHADGHLTLGAPDSEQGLPGLGRFLAGPPRIAPFLADLDPSRGGSLSAHLLPDRAVFAWTDVPGGSQVNRNTFEVALLPSGAIQLTYGEMGTREALVGVSPGSGGTLTPADLSAAEPAEAAGALVEVFSESERVDLVSVARRFYASHADVFDQLVVYTTRPLNPVGGTLAFEINVRNDVSGIGLPRFDRSGEWGSAGRLESVVFMDAVSVYADVDGLEILGHEVGHRWLSNLRFRDPGGTESTALLGRGLAHWSFFMDTDASVLEGNDIEERGGRFETVDIARGYSALDQYAMGLRSAEEVPPFHYVAEADDFRPDRPYKSSSSPEVGVSFTGVRRSVRIDDVVAALGPRVPEASSAPRVLRQAYVLVADGVGPATPQPVAVLGRIRRRFEDYFRAATAGRGWVDTRLD